MDKVEKRVSDDDMSEEICDDYDSHSCRANADAWGYCQVCGAIVYGSVAYCEEYGCDPPGTY